MLQHGSVEIMNYSTLMCVQTCLLCAFVFYTFITRLLTVVLSYRLGSFIPPPLIGVLEHYVFR